MAPFGDPPDERARAWSDGLRRELATRVGTAVADAVWVTGSVGRGEAVPGSDLESLAVVDDPGDRTVRRAVASTDLSPAPWFAETSTASAADPRLVRTRAGWSTAADDWAGAPARDLGVVHLGLLADARPLVDGHDQPDLLPCLAVQSVRAHPAVLADVLADALSTRASVPSRFARNLRSDPVVDLKASVLTPVVKLARWAALRAGVTATATDARLELAADPRILPADRWDSLRVAARVTARLRWDVRLRAGSEGPGTDLFPLSTLTTAERAGLRSAAREIAGAQRTLDYLRSAGELREPG
ncbi:putative nucleotidyltransferase substrate binding domain-containing protein [Rhodococcus sp. IEGM 1408]|uniref:putative nucleotidyltransferase substrate binding domain-containing protein n=1 Tax=Rhodococcus sp. IEGM 1408 TaxID=3082220 RepID=UPI002954881A|nr:putative nucleotidyltransferase substrate binding domain-containing protein [Rhodococcus sp. IEGM 1408]MDV8001960.1 putative nucleotidyltransferase substrate binding domain-containing protein [Rhodococcus sp. IEGM 1408]